MTTPRALSIAAAVGTLLVAAVARAEPIALASGFPQRTGTTHGVVGDGSGISRIDCLDPLEGWRMSFVLPTGVAFDTLQLWARADAGSCADPAARGPGKACARVASFTQAQVIAGATVTVPSAAMVEAAALRTDVGSAPVDRTAACFPAGDEPPTPFTLELLLFAGAAVVGGVAPNAYEASLSSVYDRSGPAGPQDLTTPASPSTKGSIDARWTASVSPDVRAVNAYCFDLDAAGVTGCALPDGVKTAGGWLIPEVDRSPCVTGANAGVLRIDGLRRNHPYAIALAYVDALGNTGALSNVSCATPTGDLAPAGTPPADPPPPAGCSCRLTAGAGSNEPGLASIVAGTASAAMVALVVRRRRRRRECAAPNCII